MIFLIEYDRGRGEIVSLRSFEAARRAQAEDARLDLELSLNSNGLEREVVLLDAASEGAIRRSHRRYFEQIQELATISEFDQK